MFKMHAAGSKQRCQSENEGLMHVQAAFLAETPWHLLSDTPPHQIKAWSVTVGARWTCCLHSALPEIDYRDDAAHAQPCVT